MLANQIIIRPYQTERSLELTEKNNQYTFIVNPKANKIEITKAIESAFKVNVLKVNTVVVKGKTRRVRGHVGKNPNYKKAIVTLKKGEKIEFV
jgi:large subunit ribosomal protein L23